MKIHQKLSKEFEATTNIIENSNQFGSLSLPLLGPMLYNIFALLTIVGVT